MAYSCYYSYNCVTTVAIYTLLVLTLLVLTLQAEESPKLSEVDINVLVSIKDSLTDLPGSTFFSTWDFLEKEPCSTFAGITCMLSSNTLRVTTLELGMGLSGMLGLAGTLPGTISELSELTQLILNPGMVTGPIPGQLGKLSNLRVLFMSHNRLTGPIPPGLTKLTQLHTLDLSFNRLTGPIPPTLLTGLTQLKVLVLASNQLAGELPECFITLLHLDLKFNHLVGQIPNSLPLTLRYVSLSHNLMWGPLNGTVLEALPSLSYLDLSYNKFSGILPSSFFNPLLSTLLLSHNNLSGKITVSDTQPVVYPDGSTLDLSHNGFSSNLPEEAAGAENIFLNNNCFSGPIPGAFGDGIKQGNIKTLYVQHNFLDGFPKNVGPILPDNAEVCLAYNCMVPPSGLSICPTSAGGQVSRPASQCSIFHNG